MKLPIAFLSCIVVFAVIATAPYSTAEEGDGWIALFDGKTLQGWKHSTLGAAKYTVVDGSIRGETGEGPRNSFLLSEGEYGDFELEFDVKVHDSLNSGVQIRSREKTETDAPAKADGSPSPALHVVFGPQIEIEKSPGQSGYIYGEATGLAWLSPEPKQTPMVEHSILKNGEWNHYRVIVKGARIQTFINGAPVADLTHEEVYKTHPKGHIGLQVHAIKAGTGPYDVAWKNIRIRPLP